MLYVSGYYVYRNGLRVNSIPINALVYEDTGTTVGQTYTYYVTAYDGIRGIESAPSNKITITVEESWGK